MIVQCPISLGELVDKLTILEIKFEKISDENKKDHIKNEMEQLSDLLNSLKLEGVIPLKEQLRGINLQLWDIEDDIRDLEAEKNFGAKFVELARSVYKTNDLRFSVKKNINETFGSNIQEVKSYKEY